MNEQEKISEQLCSIIQESLPKAERSVKWNAPNFSVAGQDLITLNFSPRHPVRVVFHRGAKAVDTKTSQRMIDDVSGLLTWASDQRAYASFPTVESVTEHADWLMHVAKAWVLAVKSQSKE